MRNTLSHFSNNQLKNHSSNLRTQFNPYLNSSAIDEKNPINDLPDFKKLVNAGGKTEKKTSSSILYQRVCSLIKKIYSVIKKVYSNFKKLPLIYQNVIVFVVFFFLFYYSILTAIEEYNEYTDRLARELAEEEAIREKYKNFHYDLWDEMFGPEEPEPTWWERIKFKIFGEPEEEPEPYISWDDRLANFYTRWSVHQSHRDYIENILNPPEPAGLEKIKIEIRRQLKNLFDILWIWIKQTAIDTWNLSKFFAYYIDKNLRYVVDAIPISESTWDYLTLLGVAICSLNYMYTLMRYDEVLYTKVLFLEFRHIPIREIHFFHEYFLCWSAIIVCLLLFTQVK